MVIGVLGLVGIAAATMATVLQLRGISVDRE
jgi:hypothetical protein